MKMIVKFIALAVLISSTLSECNEGCLVCRPNGICLLCDFINAYYLSNNSCSKDSFGNCKLYQVNSTNGSCLLCNDGYYLDSTQKCVEVTTEIENCQSYSSNSSCIQCVSGYVISGNTCAEVVNKINNCKIYSSTTSTTCLECEDNYILSIDQTSCEYNPSIRNCSHFSYIGCLSCNSGYLLHLNSYLDDFKTSISANNASLINAKLYSVLRGSIDQTSSSTCLNTEGTNCLEFNSIGTCSTCASGYYLNEKNVCVINPIQPINNCQFYSSLTTCAICDAGYHLDTFETCVADIIIEDCLTYNSSAISTTCIACTSDFYLSNNTCLLRTNTEITNCSEYSVTEDKCIACVSTDVVSTDGLKCLTPILNCATYADSNASTEVLSCVGCDNGYYLNSESNTCVAGTIANCLIFENSSDVCQTCRDGFYLSDSQCATRTVIITNCTTYSTTLNDSCEACSSTSLLFSLNSSCRTIETISNCSSYEEYNICSLCNDGYYLTDNTCVSIPSGENCLRKSDEACTLCKSGYYLEEGSCYAVPEVATTNCATTESNPTSPNTCLGCNKNFIPFEHTDKYLCRNPTNVTGTLITNCVKYLNEDGVLKCTRCQSTHIVSSDGLSCVLTCGSNETVLIGDVTFTEQDVYTNVTIESYKKCYNVENDEELEGCSMAAIALNAPNNKKACLKCSDGYIPVQSCPVEIAYFNPSNINNTDLGSSYVALECTQNSNAKYAPGSSSTALTNCSYYITDGNDNYYCKRCAFGYTSSVQTENDITFVTCTESVVGCDATVRYGGVLSNAEWMEEMFGFNISHTYSCHKCTTDTQIPFLHLSYQNEMIPYGLGNDTPSSSDTLTDHHVTCREPTATGLQMSESQFTNFPSNCALGYYVVDKSKISKLELGTTAMCLACKNGFKPIYDEDEFIITGCEAISNCDTSSATDGWFNSCKTCSSGYAFQYDSTGHSLKTDVCVATSNANCLAIDAVNASCSICNKNYSLNYDGVCESLKPNACTNYVQLAQNNFNSSNTYNNLGLAFYYLLDDGCLSCNNDYVLLKELTAYETCISSPYVTAATFPESTKYISNCDSYYLESDALYCNACASGYIPNVDNTKCIISTTFSNCAVTNTEGTACSTCNSQTTKVGTVCVNRSISNCETYDEGNSTITCLGCRSGYVLASNLCLLGTVANCDIYDQTSSLCTTCNSGYVLITSTGTGQQCMAIPSSLNCSQAELASNNQELVCTSCSSGFSFTYNTDDFNQNTCISINTVSNCLTYDIVEDLTLSTFKCTECATLYYLNNSICVSRTITEGCSSYDPIADKCTGCNNNYYLNSKSECIAFFVGINNCETYSDVSTCSECQSGYYLANNACNAVPTDNLVAECNAYSNETTCSSCNSGYVLVVNTCEKAVAEDCVTYTDINNCSTCPSGYYLSLNTSNQITNCIKGEIANCAEIRTVEPLTCIKCSGAYVLNNSGGCTAVATQIINCISYDDATELCTACDSGFILSTDQKSCNAFTGPTEYSSCNSLKYVETPVCTLCNPGYYFDENICVKCTSQNYETGCLYCDYSDQETCLICRSGFIQDADGNCSLNTSLITAFENDVSHSHILSSILIVLVGLYLFKN